ncbi:MAG: hypothetical protein RQ756_01990, partial [Flavobacteriaceae bacterium]|nr:hypothetical protein [Flavobacteriaceae bacterium]
MIRTLIITMLLMQSCVLLAQRSTSSPYSFFGLGTLQFNGTIENRSMGGMNTFSDSIHLNLLNPAGLHKLRYVTYTLGGITRTTNLRTVDEKQNVNNTTLEYLAIGIPLNKKSGLSFGILPYSSVGYDLTSITEASFTNNTGTGGVNRVFVNYGYKLFNNLSAGLSLNYNFGEIENRTLLLQNGIQFGTREDNLSELRGFNFRLGLLYEKTLKNEKI